MPELQKYSLKEELVKKDEELMDSLSLLAMSALTQPAYINSMRSVMFTSHLKQFLNMPNSEFPYYFMGSENCVGKHNTGSFKEADGDMQVYRKIVKFKDIVDDPTVYVVFFYNYKKQRYEVVERKELEDLIENFGVPFNNEFIDSLEEGDMVNSGEVLYKSASYDEDMNYGYGKNAVVMYTLDPNTAEDAAEVRKGFAYDCEHLESDTHEICYNDNDFFLNMFGDDDNFKVIPDIGEFTDKGYLCAIRRQFNNQLFYDFKKSSLSEIHESDDVRWVDGAQQVVDIDIYNNQEGEIEDTKFTKQINKYLRSQNEYYREILETCEEIINSGEAYAPDIDYLYKRAGEMLGIEKTTTKWRTTKETSPSKMVIRITVKKMVPLHKGNKITGRFGNKSVISRVVDDDDMPFTEDGRKVDVMIHLLAITNRTTSAPLYEICTNSINYQLRKQLKAMDNMKQRENLFFDMHYMFNEKQCEETYEMYRKMNKKEKEEFWRSVIEEGIYTCEPPMFETKPMFYRIRDILAKFEWLQPENVYINKWGKKIKLLSKMWIGEMYIMVLKQSDRRGFSARSSGAIDQKSLPTRSFKSKAHMEQYSSSCIRFGEFETLNFSIAVIPEDIALFHAMYRTSIKGRKDLGELLFNDPDSDRIYKIDKSYTSRVAEVFSVILKSLSIGIDFIDDDDIVSLTSDDEINVHTLDGKVLLCTDYQFMLLERIQDIEQELMENNPVLTADMLRSRVIDELNNRNYICGSVDAMEDLEAVEALLN